MVSTIVGVSRPISSVSLSEGSSRRAVRLKISSLAVEAVEESIGRFGSLRSVQLSSSSSLSAAVRSSTTSVSSSCQATAVISSAENSALKSATVCSGSSSRFESTANATINTTTTAANTISGRNLFFLAFMQLLLVSAPAAQDEDHHADDQAGQRQHNDKQQAERHNQVAGHRQCFGAHAAGFDDGSVFLTVHPVQDAAHKLGVAARNRCVDFIGKDIPAVDPRNRTARGCVLGCNGDIKAAGRVVLALLKSGGRLVCKHRIGVVRCGKQRREAQVFFRS